MAAVSVFALGTCAPGLPAAQVTDRAAAAVGDAALLGGVARAGFEPGAAAARLDIPSPFDNGGASRAPAAPEGGEDRTEFPPVTVRRPSIRLSGPATPGVDPVAAALEVPGVTFATSVLVGTLPITPGDAARELNVVAVDPAGFRLFVPQVTADAVDVWHRIVEGDAAFTHDVGHALEADHGIELGERIPLAGGDETLRVGAYASNGAPPLAGAVIARGRAAELGFSGERVVLVSTASDADLDAISGALQVATGLAAEVVPAPPTRRAFLTGAASREAFEPFTYVSLGDGMIQIERDWVRRNIVSAEVPVFRGSVTCHRLMIPQLRGALQEIADRGLDHLIDPSEYGGCWTPRHILFNPRRPLSMHAWGLAIDLNVSTNQYGAEPTLDPRIVEIFKRWGFAWGGDWSTPDGMHFELSALMQRPEG